MPLFATKMPLFATKMPVSHKGPQLIIHPVIITHHAQPDLPAWLQLSSKIH